MSTGVNPGDASGTDAKVTQAWSSAYPTRRRRGSDRHPRGGDVFNHGEDDLESGTREDGVTRDEEDEMVRRLPVDAGCGGAPKRATVLFVASIGTPLAGLVAVLTLGGSDALPLVLAGVAALALLTAWVTSGMSDDDAEPSSSSRPHPDPAGPTRRDDHEE